MKFKSIILIIYICVLPYTFAADHKPFGIENRSFNFPYMVDEESREFFIGGKPVLGNDRIIFDTGESVIFKHLLGFGDNTIIFEDLYGRAIRIPKTIGHGDDFTSGAIKYMFDGYRQAMSNINYAVAPSRSVKVYQEAFESENVIAVERIEIEETLDTYLSDIHLNRSDQKYSDLLTFLNDFRIFKYIHEFLPFQIGWVKNRGWVLFDIGASALLNPKGVRSTKLDVLLQFWEDNISESVLLRLREDFEKLFGYYESAVSCRQIL